MDFRFSRKRRFTRAHIDETEFSSTTVILDHKAVYSKTCFWFLIFDNYLYFGLYIYAEIHFLLLMFLKEHPIMFLNQIVISTRHVYTCTCKCGGEPCHIVKPSTTELSGY